MNTPVMQRSRCIYANLEGNLNRIRNGILLLILKTKDLGAAAGRDSREQVILLNQIAGCAAEKADDLKELEKDGFHCDYVIVDTTDNILYSHIEKATAPDNISVE